MCTTQWYDHLQNCVYLQTYSDRNETTWITSSTTKRQGDQRGVGQVAGNEVYPVKTTNIIAQC